MDFLISIRGRKAVLLKLAIILAIDVLGLWILMAAIGKSAWTMAGVIGVALVAINAVYLIKGLVPFKFLLPGLIFLSVFVIFPISYTAVMATFNYKTGNELNKPAALEQLLIQGLIADPDGTSYDLRLGRTDAGDFAGLLTDQIDGSVLFATEDGTRPLEQDEYEVDEFGVAFDTDGFTPFADEELADVDSEISDLRFPLDEDSFAAPEGADIAVKLSQGLDYEPETDTVINIETGARYADNGEGNYENIDGSGEVLEPGWRAFNSFKNFSSLITDSRLRAPFLKVFVWTIAFAFLSVFTTFVVGFALSLAFQKSFRGRRLYRAILILPYAIPSFMSILVWAGLFNRDYGAINAILGQTIGWFDDPWLARFTILLVNLWLGFPYMYLITTGALQGIPSELNEAAAIDGASAWQSLRKITMPLLLQILAPLLIASFAFNFNNFNIIYLLTGGGPTDEIKGEVAGSTDILISYTYKTAFDQVQANYGLASAISVLVFFIVGGLSMWSLRRSKVLEEMQ
jgi:arabinogalactan oligomer / maltooligosaccharide transport system permease protein